ncbi:hypothetical protein [Methylobacterium haplocladii]|uniref:Uncharacterized protein n=1 Tax=Methylobacterium haplocladii TaxID=1176176 RepID=A0A512ISR6_9HYPH|nr:hypothetical protein [Methylobacterium haplocladii]GEP00754.1 hypothetical protein MHA02_31410 [Methylobacterium haplocladii]GJD83088.1 hypothetical protein HPGCJGGD_0950 [Methylobacterium haplocladii]GLS60687.1 hypothetical protein GCM10007887_33710 [Methylobacterium haplocladii]
MKRIAALAILTGALVLPMAAQAENSGGSREVAGGAHMSSYVTDPYHDPRSAHSQRNSTGQILGAPMLSENAGAHNVRSRLADPQWTTGSTGRRAR